MSESPGATIAAWAAAAVAALSLAFTLVARSKGELAAKIARLAEEVVALRAEIVSLKAEIVSLRAENLELLRQIARMDNQ